MNIEYVITNKFF